MLYFCTKEMEWIYVKKKKIESQLVKESNQMQIFERWGIWIQKVLVCVSLDGIEKELILWVL